MNTNPGCPACRYFSPRPESRGVESKEVLMFVDWLTKQWIYFYLDLHDRLKACGHRVQIVDISAFTFPQEPCSFTRSINLEKGPEFLVVRRLIPTWPGRFAKDAFEIQLRDSVRSHSATRFHGKSNSFSESMNAHVLRMTARSLYTQLPQFNSKESIWIFQNGRFPHQRALLEYSKHKGTDHLIMESNLYWKSQYWARPYPPHDRQSLQEETVSRASQIGVAQRNRANSWFSEHSSPQSKTNKFTKRFLTLGQKEVISEQTFVSKNAVIFASSSDEFVGLGHYWPPTGWNSQYEAFLHVSKILKGLGYSITLRIHPNFENKSLRAIKEDYSHITRLVQECPMTLIGPQSSANSYALLDSAEVVVVSASTIGLEALHRGKKVIVTEHSNFDLLPGVLKVWPKTDAQSIVEFIEAPLVLQESSATDWAAVQMSLGWSARERPGVVRNLPIFEHLKWYLNWRTIAYYISALVPRLFENIPRKGLLRKITRLEHYQNR